MANVKNLNQELNYFNLKDFGLKTLKQTILDYSGATKLNKIIEKNINRKGVDFIDNFLDELNIEFSFPEKDLKKIPKKGPFIAISNHPLGAIDYLLFIKLFAKIRPDIKLISKFVLKKLSPIEDFLIVEESDYLDEKDYSYSILTEAYQLIKSNVPVGIFPASEIVRLSVTGESFTDKKWLKQVMRYIKYAQVPVVPVFFSVNDSLINKMLKVIYPKFILPNDENKSKKSYKIKARIGNPISVEEQSEFHDLSQYSRFLRAKTYMLNANTEIDKFFFPKFLSSENEIPESIIPETPKELLIDEIFNLKNNLIIAQQNFEVYYAESAQIPNILNEIGRLREITFREVGEGTNKSIDLDEYDLYYNHLILWDKDASEICGAYRIGKGFDIYSKFGKNGFYISSLFKFADGFVPVLQKSMELGRSFIVKNYQQKRLPLFLLWKGLMFFILKFPEYQYLIGPVSISNSYSKVSKSVIVDFLKKNHFNLELSYLVRPRKPFAPNLSAIENAINYENIGDDFKNIDKILDDLEIVHSSSPILLKKYIRENAKIISFNIDPKFNDALDGLIILDLKDIRLDTLETFSSNINVV